MEAEDTGLRINTQYPAAEVESAIPFIEGGIIGKPRTERLVE